MILKQRTTQSRFIRGRSWEIESETENPNRLDTIFKTLGEPRKVGSRKIDLSVEDPGKKSPRKLDSWFETIEGYEQNVPSNYKPSTKMGIESETGKDVSTAKRTRQVPQVTTSEKWAT